MGKLYLLLNKERFYSYRFCFFVAKVATLILAIDAIRTCWQVRGKGNFSKMEERLVAFCGEYCREIRLLWNALCLGPISERYSRLQ